MASNSAIEYLRLKEKYLQEKQLAEEEYEREQAFQHEIEEERQQAESKRIAEEKEAQEQEKQYTEEQKEAERERAEEEMIDRLNKEREEWWANEDAKNRGEKPPIEEPPLNKKEKAEEELMDEETKRLAEQKRLIEAGKGPYPIQEWPLEKPTEFNTLAGKVNTTGSMYNNRKEGFTNWFNWDERQKEGLGTNKVFGGGIPTVGANINEVIPSINPVGTITSAPPVNNPPLVTPGVNTEPTTTNTTSTQEPEVVTPYNDTASKVLESNAYKRYKELYEEGRIFFPGVAKAVESSDVIEAEPKAARLFTADMEVKQFEDAFSKYQRDWLSPTSNVFSDWNDRMKSWRFRGRDDDNSWDDDFVTYGLDKMYTNYGLNENWQAILNIPSRSLAQFFKRIHEEKRPLKGIEKFVNDPIVEGVGMTLAGIAISIATGGTAAPAVAGGLARGLGGAVARQTAAEAIGSGIIRGGGAAAGGALGGSLGGGLGAQAGKFVGSELAKILSQTVAKTSAEQIGRSIIEAAQGAQSLYGALAGSTRTSKTGTKTLTQEEMDELFAKDKSLQNMTDEELRDIKERTDSQYRNFGNKPNMSEIEREEEEEKRQAGIANRNRTNQSHTRFTDDWIPLEPEVEEELNIEEELGLPYSTSGNPHSSIPSERLGEINRQFINQSTNASDILEPLIQHQENRGVLDNLIASARPFIGVATTPYSGPYSFGGRTNPAAFRGGTWHGFNIYNPSKYHTVISKKFNE